MSDAKLPFVAEYSKSNRSRCNCCTQAIAKDVLRLGVMVQAKNFDGKIPLWYHEDCFFKPREPADTEYTHPRSEWEIARFQQLRYEDQIKVRDKIASSFDSDETISLDKDTDDVVMNVDEASTLQTFVASTNISCSKCCKDITAEEKFIKNTVDGKEESLHFDCFHSGSDAKLKTEKEVVDKTTSLPECSMTKETKRSEAQGMIRVLDDQDVPKKKIKIESNDGTDADVQKTEEQKIAEQQQAFYGLRDQLKALKIDKSDLIELLVYNDQAVPRGIDSILDHVCDLMMFGALERCSVCGARFVFQESTYVCTGNLSKWTQCLNEVATPARRKTYVKDELKNRYTIFREYECIVSERIIRRMTQAPVQRGVYPKQRVTPKQLPLANMEFVIVGKTPTPEDQLSAKIQQLGGKVVQQINKHTAAIISTKEEVKRMCDRMREAKELQIQVVSENIIERAPDGDVLSLIASQAICDWGSDPHARSPTKDDSGSTTSPLKSLPSKMKFQMKSGLVVDPDSGLADEAHVYKKGDIIYNCVLNMVDIQRDRNSFYKLQVLEADSSRKYWLFRAWGRIGTTVGGTKIQDFKNANDAVNEFHKWFSDKTANNWKSHDSPYVKHAGLFYPIEIDYSEKSAKSLPKDSIESTNRSKLAPAVQDLIRMIFDVDLMNRVMLEFELDMEKMPLGKLSQRQLQAAMVVLSEIASLLTTHGSKALFIDASNRFYSLVPHNFGLDPVKVLDTMEQVSEKLAMLENLMQIEFAYSLLHAGESEGSKSVLDVHYERLSTHIEPMERSSEEFALLQQYVRNTHAATHKDYQLEIEEIFRIKRNGEDNRYEPFRGLHNRKLLWHGSRLTNFVGILSNGLRIAPPEAPATGYMFGKGIYFADMVSKSANYCFTNPADPKGLMLLCEVALGNMQEYTRAHFVERLPTGKHSVKGIGRTQPDPSVSHTRADGVEIPLGNGVTKEDVKSDLLYNEFIVYDVAQVSCQYLLKMKFQYKTFH